MSASTLHGQRNLWKETKRSIPIDDATFEAAIEGHARSHVPAFTSADGRHERFLQTTPAATRPAHARETSSERVSASARYDRSIQPGVNNDEHGAPIPTHAERDGRIFSGVKRDAYGLGVNMDQFGRPVTTRA